MSLRRASSVCLVRGEDRVEVLMVQRPMTARFMPGVWVFPGGTVDPEDAALAAGYDEPEIDDWRIAAVRELAEETGLRLTDTGLTSGPIVADPIGEMEASGSRFAAGELIYFSNWITPSPFPIRFDTRFFLAVAKDEVEERFNQDELDDVAWVEPLEALQRSADREWDIAFPTQRILEMLSVEPTAGALAATYAALDLIPPIQPRLFVDDQEARIVLPGDDDFEAVAEAQEDPKILDRLRRVVDQGGRFPAEFKRRS